MTKAVYNYHGADWKLKPGALKQPDFGLLDADSEAWELADRMTNVPTFIAVLASSVNTITANMTIQDVRLPLEIYQTLSDASQTCLANITEYLSALQAPDFPPTYQPKVAAVLVLLYEEHENIRVLLTTRAQHLRTHAGQTALPGGKMDSTDVDLVMTAFREAHEEVALPRNSPHIHTLGCMQPFISLHKILVTPVVAFLSKPELLKSLQASPSEVSHIFSHPLEAILDPTLSKQEPLVPIGSEDWPYESEVYNTSDPVVQMLGGTAYRMHRFRTSASPIKGLTADILIKLAEVAYARPTTYVRYAPGQLENIVDMVRAVLSSPPAASSSTALKIANDNSATLQ